MCCPLTEGSNSTGLWFFGLKLFLLVWVIAVPVIITSRLERIIKQLEELNRNNN